MCVSLVSYRSSQCAAVFAHKADQPNFTPGDVLQYGHPEEWPTDASLFAALDAADGTAPSCSFTLSPPFTQVSLSSPRSPPATLMLDTHVASASPTIPSISVRAESGRV